ncbi:MAG: hypothetical protein ACI4MS_04375 [Candidatus Coproplasma sp.]
MSNKSGSRLSPVQKAIIIIASIFIFINVVYLTCLIGERIAYGSFFSNAKAEFSTPGMNKGFVGQGLDYLEEQNAFLSCGYNAKKGKPSSVYYINAKGKSREIVLKNADGSAYTGHTGGIAHYGDYVFITGSSGCDVFNLSDFTSGNSEAKKIGEIYSPEGHDPAFVTIKGNMLYEGSFYRKGNYETPENERITTPFGDNNVAIIYAYELGGSENLGVSANPVEAYSVRGLVQGMTFTENSIVLSCSWGLSASHLYFYNMESLQQGQLTVGGEQIPIKYLDSSCLVKTVKAPPMSEEIVYKDGKIYIMTESASNKYVFGKIMSGNKIYSYKTTS